MKNLLYWLFFISAFKIIGQDVQKHHLKLNIEVPVQMGFGYQYCLNERFSVYSQLGFLTEPNTSIILNTLEGLGTEAATISLLESAFSSGIVAESGLLYHFKSFYIGSFIQYIYLNGEDNSEDLIENLLDIELPERRRTVRTNPNPVSDGEDITLKTRLLQMGMLFGKNFHLTTRSYLFTELAISRNLTSNSFLSSPDRNLNAASVSMDDYLDSVYASYAYIPSISVGYAIKL